MTKAVILAAGWGTRMKPLTFSKPKPILPVAGKTVLEYNLEELKDLVEEVIIVVGYKEEVIREKIGEEYKGVKIKYVKQKEQLGTGHAAKVALPFLEEDFLILNGDDLYLKEDIEKVLLKNPSIMVKEIEDPSGYGQVLTGKETVKEIVEKPPETVSNLINVGCYYLNKNFFQKEIEKSSRGEYEIIDFLKFFVEGGGDLYYATAKNWHPMTYPWHLLDANETLMEKMKGENKGKVESNCFLLGEVKIEEGVLIKTGTRIEGPVHIKSGTVVGPNAFIRGKTVIGKNSKIGHGVEIKNSIIGDNTFFSHLNYLGDSVVGDGCLMGGGAIAANLRFDKKEVKVHVKEKMVNTHRKKMGVIMGDNSFVGINTSLMPGVIIGSEAVVGPHKMVKRNIEEKEKYL